MMRKPDEIAAHLAAAAALFAARAQAMPPGTKPDVLAEVAERAIWQARSFAEQWAKALEEERKQVPPSVHL